MHVVYHPKVKSEDIPRLVKTAILRIRKAIEDRLCLDPEQFGRPLRRGLQGYRKFRVGDYRIIYKIDHQDIKILIIGHRQDVYDKTNKR